MVNYVCRTCLYVCDNEFSFRKLEKVLPVLELFVPEVKNCIGKYSLVCEQCYYFLKNIEKFKVKCIETQKKLYSMNIETIKNNNNAVLKSFVNQTLVPENQTRLNKKFKRDDSEITLANILKSSTTANSNQSTASTSKHNDLIQLLNSYAKDINELKGFREFAAKPLPAQSQRGNVSINEVIMNYEDDATVEEDNNSNNQENEEDEYMTRKDLVAAGILSDHDHDSSTDNNIELVNSEGEQNVSNKPMKKNLENPITSVAVVKTELKDNENPGFFNKVSTDGYYKCRLCNKKYKTSHGLHRHTKEKHSDEVKMYHCNSCSFFSLWKSALMRHYSVFHGKKFESRNKSSKVKCSHCSFETTSKDRLSRHILDNHAYKKSAKCTLRTGRFSDDAAYARHIETKHLPLPTSSSYCLKCTLIFLSDEEYESHLKEKHGEILCQNCKMVFGSVGEFHEHRKSVHSTPFGASALP